MVEDSSQAWDTCIPARSSRKDEGETGRCPGFAGHFHRWRRQWKEGEQIEDAEVEAEAEEIVGSPPSCKNCGRWDVGRTSRHWEVRTDQRGYGDEVVQSMDMGSMEDKVQDIQNWQLDLARTGNSSSLADTRESLLDRVGLHRMGSQRRSARKDWGKQMRGKELGSCENCLLHSMKKSARKTLQIDSTHWTSPS